MTRPVLSVIAAVAAAALVSACGAVQDAGPGASTAQAEPPVAEEVLPAPPIEAIDEPAPEDALTMLPPPPSAEGWTNYAPLTCVPPGVDPPVELGEPQGPCPDEMLEEILGEERRVLPAKAADARAIARLRLEEGGAAYLVDYRSRRAGRCLLFYLEDGAGLPAGGSAGGLPCSEGGQTFCGDVCLMPVSWSPGVRVVVAGFVDAGADGIRIRFEDGYVARYPLTGPLLPHDPARRIFMVEQTHGLHVAVELLRGDEVVATGDGLPGPGSLPPELEEELQGTPGVEFELDGRTLRVEIGPEAPPEAQALLEDDEVVFACFGLEWLGVEIEGEDDLPPSHALGRFPAGERAVTVQLGADVEGRAAGCVAASDLGVEEPEAVRMLIPWEELAELVEPED